MPVAYTSSLRHSVVYGEVMVLKRHRRKRRKPIWWMDEWIWLTEWLTESKSRARNSFGNLVLPWRWWWQRNKTREFRIWQIDFWSYVQMCACRGHGPTSLDTASRIQWAIDMKTLKRLNSVERLPHFLFKSHQMSSFNIESKWCGRFGSLFVCNCRQSKIRFWKTVCEIPPAKARASGAMWSDPIRIFCHCNDILQNITDWRFYSTIKWHDKEN